MNAKPKPLVLVTAEPGWMPRVQVPLPEPEAEQVREALSGIAALAEADAARRQARKRPVTQD